MEGCAGLKKDTRWVEWSQVLGLSSVVFPVTSGSSVQSGAAVTHNLFQYGMVVARVTVSQC